MKRTLPLLLSLLPLTLAHATDPTLEGKSGFDRRTTISTLADSHWDTPFSPPGVVDLLSTMGGSDRYYALRSLLGENRRNLLFLPQQLPAAALEPILSGLGDQRQEIVQLMAEQGVPADRLSVAEIEQMLSPLSQRDYPAALLALLGNNRHGHNYSLPRFTLDEANRVLQPVAERTGMIRFLADRDLLPEGIDATNALSLIGEQSGMGRHDTLKTLLGWNRLQRYYLALPATMEEVNALLQGSDLRVELVRYLADHPVYPERMSALEAQQLLEGITQTDRFNALRSLLGENLQQRSYLSLPLTATELTPLLAPAAHRDELIGWMADLRMIDTGLTAQEGIELLQGLRGMPRYRALLALLGENSTETNHFALPFRFAEATALTTGAAHRDQILQQLADQQLLPHRLGGSEAATLLEGLSGETRAIALQTLLGENRQQHHYLVAPVEQHHLVDLLDRSSRRLELLQRMVQLQLIPVGLSAEQQAPLLQRLYGEEREVAIQLLSGE